MLSIVGTSLSASLPTDASAAIFQGPDSTLLPSATAAGHPPHRLFWLAAILFSVLSVCACTSITPLDAESVVRHSGFLRDGLTKVQEVDERLGAQHASYEGGRIRIYRAYFDEQDRLTLMAIPGATCHALVLVFDGDDRLQRHGLVKDGCLEEKP
ncbi:MAG: hypothetical protein OEL80_05785 [Desulfuromonadales bacterium]|nr:hypothetical protein [Desulfuromonadales bacterium]